MSKRCRSPRAGVVPESWGCLPSPTGSRRRWWPGTWRPGWSRFSTRIPSVTGRARRRWKFDWVIEFDIRKFFDTVPWDQVVAAVEAHTDAGWVVLYVKRWLAAGLRLPDGSKTERAEGTPQGSAVSPVLANLFLHYAFDMWMVRGFPGCPFERFADDAVIHCRTLA